MATNDAGIRITPFPEIERSVHELGATLVVVSAEPVAASVLFLEQRPKRFNESQNIKRGFHVTMGLGQLII